MEAAVFQVWIYLQTQMGLLRARRLSCVWGWGSGLEFEAAPGDPSPASPRCVCSCLFSSSLSDGC